MKKQNSIYLICVTSVLYFFSLSNLLAQVPQPVACYNFSGNLNEANGGTPLTTINGLGNYSVGSVLCGIDSLYSWNVGQGLDLVIGNTFPKDNYTIELLFEFTSVPYQKNWQRIIDFKNNTDDLGLYTYWDNSINPNTYNLQMYTQYTGTSNIAQPNTWFRLFLTRDASTNMVNGYINNNLEISFLDNISAAAFISDLVLFKDDIVVIDEESAGTIDYLRIYDQPLTLSQISQIISVSTPTVTISSFNQNICLGDSLLLVASGATNYLWNNGATVDSIIVTPSSNMIYSVTGWNYLFCTKSCEESDTVAITVTSSLQIVTSSDTLICPESSVNLTASGADNYLWSPSAGLSSSTGSMVMAAPASTTTYTVIGTLGSNCVDTSYITVTVDTPNAVAEPNDATIIKGETVTLTANGGGAYQWLPSTGLSCTNCQIVVANPDVTTTYYVIVTDANGCPNIDSVRVTVLDKETLYIPNAFTPNGDKNNNLFYVYGSPIKNFNMMIFNRWGQLIYQSKDIAEGWNGTYQNKICEEGIYLCLINCIWSSNREEEIISQITLLY